MANVTSRQRRALREVGTATKGGLDGAGRLSTRSGRSSAVPSRPAAIKRLDGRHGTREEEVDRLLRAGAFVDLYRAVR